MNKWLIRLNIVVFTALSRKIIRWVSYLVVIGTSESSLITVLFTNIRSIGTYHETFCNVLCFYVTFSHCTIHNTTIHNITLLQYTTYNTQYYNTQYNTQYIILQYTTYNIQYIILQYTIQYTIYNITIHNIQYAILQ